MFSLWLLCSARGLIHAFLSCIRPDPRGWLNVNNTNPSLCPFLPLSSRYLLVFCTLWSLSASFWSFTSWISPLLPLLLRPTSVSRYHVNVSLYLHFEVVKPLVTLYVLCLRGLTTWHIIVTM